MPKGLTDAETAAKWVKNTLANKDTARRGVEAVTESPTAKAAAAEQRYADGCAEAASSGRFARACRAVTLDDWRTAYIEKGLKNLDVGVKQAESKMTRFLSSYLPYIRQRAEQIRKMPKGTRADAMARIEANLNALDQFKATRGR